MRKKYLLFILVVGLALPNLGTVRRAEDPIRDTQTDAILYKQKMEEEKDGKKGPLTYNVKYNPSSTFLTDPPFVPDEREAPEERYQADTAMDWWEEVPTSGSAQIEEAGVFVDSDARKEETSVPPDSTVGDYWW